MSDDNRKSVLILTNGFSTNIGGVETHLDDLLCELGRRGWRVNVLAFFPLTTPVPWRRYEERGTARIWRMWWFGCGWFHRLEHYAILQFLYLVPRLFWGTLCWLLRHRSGIDVIYANGLAPAFVARFLGPLFGKRIVLGSHSIYGFAPGSRMERVMGWILRPMQAVLGLSEESTNELVRAGVRREVAATFRYWIDLERFSPGDRAAARQRLGVPAEAFVCLFVGRMIAIKGVRLLLEISKRPEFQDVLFLFAGVGPVADEVTRAAVQQPNVRYAGAIVNSDLPDYYRVADVLAVPSQYAEGFGRVILEALSCGTPVIGSDCAGIREATSPEVAWLIKPTATKLATLLAQVLSDPAATAAKRARCRQFALERYSTANVAVIERALGG